MEDKYKKVVTLYHIAKIEGLFDFGHSVEFMLNPEATREEQVETLRKFLSDSIQTLDLDMLIDEVHKMLDGEPSVYQENVITDGVVH